MITYNIHSLFPTIEQAFRHALFQVGIVITTTGYASTDFNKWPEFSKFILVMLMFSVLIISIGNFDFTSNFTAVVATLNNIGPGLNIVGPTGNFSMYSNLSKIVMIFDMLAGRLELFPMLLLINPYTWKEIKLRKNKKKGP